MAIVLRSSRRGISRSPRARAGAGLDELGRARRARRAARATPRGGTACSRPAGRAGAGPRPCRRRASTCVTSTSPSPFSGACDREAVVLARHEHAARSRARAPGGSRRGGRTGSLNVSSPSARPSSWWPRQMPKSGRPLVDQRAHLARRARPSSPGSPGPFASSTPSGASATTCAAVASCGQHRRRARRPRSSRRTIEALAP